MLFTITGKFSGLDVKDIEGKNGIFTVGLLLVENDNSYKNPKTGEMVPKVSNVPFKIQSKTIEICRDFKIGQIIEVQFEVVGKEYNGKNYVDLKGVFVKLGKAQNVSSTDIPF